MDTCAYTSEIRQELCNTHTSLPVTLQTSGNALSQFKRRLRDRGYPNNLVENTLLEIKFSERMSALRKKQNTRLRTLPFVTEYRPPAPNVKRILIIEYVNDIHRKSASAKRHL